MDKRQESADVLRGLAEISAYAKINERLVVEYAGTRKFPARQHGGKKSTWYSSKQAVDAWWNEQFSKAG